MAIHAVCPSCNFPYVLGDELAGNLFTCTNCQTQLHLPELPAQPLPPIDPALYRRIAGTKMPLFLSLLGLTAIQQSLEHGIAATLWASRHLFLFLSALIFILVYASSDEAALAAGPVFFLIAALLLLFGYGAAVSLATREFADNHRAPGRPSDRLSRYLLQPLLLFFADPEAALPALRMFFFAAVISGGTLLLGLRAGSLNSVVPTVNLHLNSPQSAYSQSIDTPRPAPAPIPFNPTNTQEPAPADPAAPLANATPSSTTPPAPPAPPADNAPPAPPAQSANTLTQVPPPPPAE